MSSDLESGKLFGGRGYDCGLSINLDSNGNTYISGTTNSESISQGSHGQFENHVDKYFAAMLNNNGTIIWNKTLEREYNYGDLVYFGIDFRPKDNSRIYFIAEGHPLAAVDSQGNVNVISPLYGKNILFNNDDIYILQGELKLFKLNEFREVIWEIDLENSKGTYQGGDATITNDGNILVAYEYLYSISPSGSIMWSKPLPGTANTLATNNQKEIIVGGFKNGFFGDVLCDSINEGFSFIAKFDQFGNIVWENEFKLIINDLIAIDRYSQILITGSFRDKIYLNIATMSYSFESCIIDQKYTNSMYLMRINEDGIITRFDKSNMWSSGEAMTYNRNKLSLTGHYDGDIFIANYYY
jgi:hypothetical protein